MSIHGGSPKTDGYQEEHAAGLHRLLRPATATTTRRTIRTTRTPTTSRSTSRSPTTTRRVPALAALPFASLHIGAGAHSDADNVGLGPALHLVPQAEAGDAQYGNAIEPIQDAGQVYDMLMQRVNVICAQGFEPAGDRHQRSCGPRSTRKKSLIDFRLADIADAEAGAGHGLGARAQARRSGRRLARGREGERTPSSPRSASDAAGGRSHAAARRPRVRPATARRSSTATSCRRSTTR